MAATWRLWALMLPMSRLAKWSCLWVCMALPALAQDPSFAEPPPPPPPPTVQMEAPVEIPEEAPPPPPLVEPSQIRTRTEEPLTERRWDEQGRPLAPGVPAAPAPQLTPAEASVLSNEQGPYLDGQPRQGAFLSGPGSLTFIVHHTLLGASGGLFTQGFANDFRFDRDSREAMLAGTLIGAGLGFGVSSWWQFNHWIDDPMAQFGVVNSLFGGMFASGFMHLFEDNPNVLTWSAFLGAELGAWLTAGIGGGQMELSDGLLVASGGGWALTYSALLIAIVHFSGSRVSSKATIDTLLLTPGLGAAALALATLRYHPTSSQIIRANLFGAGVGAGVLGLSALVLGGFQQSTPYVLGLLGSVGAITTVSLLWEESAERPVAGVTTLGRHSPKADRVLYW